jgi:drug/metabolite transporter (DMT)-like permease
MPTSPSHLTRGYLAGLASAAVLSTTAIFIRHLTETYQLPALVLAFWRDVCVVLGLLPVLGLFRPGWLRLGRTHWPYLAAYGLVLALFNSSWTLSVALNGAAVATVLAYCSGAFTAALGWLLLKEHLHRGKLLAIVLSLAGCVLIAGAWEPSVWHTNLAGILTGVLSGLCYAGYSLLGRSAAQRGLNPWTTLLYTFGFAALWLLLFNLLGGRALPGAAARPTDLFWLGRAWAGWGLLALLAVGPTVLGFGLYNISLVYLPSSVTNLIVTLEPAFTTVMAYLLLGERMTALQFGGGALILAGVVVLRLYEGRLG